MARKASRYKKTSRITRNGITYLGLRVSRPYEDRGDDIFYEVRAGDTLSLIAHRYFGEASLWWVVADFNDILDPFEDLVQGDVLRLPSQSRLWMEVLVDV